MTSQDLDAKQWLKREDRHAREERRSRLKWLMSEMPDVDYFFFSGGLLSKYLLEEARYCFVYGQFLATTILSLAFIERILASLFYASGRNDLERASLATLAKHALEEGWLTQEEHKWIETTRRRRNSIIHFRKLGVQPEEKAKEDWWLDNIESRSLIEKKSPYEILEQDARHALGIVYHLLGTSLMSLSSSERDND